GIGRRDDRVGVEDARQPHGPEDDRDLRPGTGFVGERQAGPSVGQQAVRYGTDERHLQQHVDDAGDHDGADQGERHVLLRVGGLAGELDALPEPQVGEDDAGGRKGREDRRDALGHEPAEPRLVEVPRVEGQDAEHDDHQDDDQQLPPDQDVVEAGEEFHAVHVDDAENGHQDDADRYARPGEHEGALDGVHQPGQVARGVLHGGQDFDGDGRRDGQPGDPAAGV